MPDSFHIFSKEMLSETIKADKWRGNRNRQCDRRLQRICLSAFLGGGTTFGNSESENGKERVCANMYVSTRST